MTTSLKQAREARGLSQDDLAKVSGVAKGTIVYLEYRRRKARPSTRRKLAKALKVKPQEIEF